MASRAKVSLEDVRAVLYDEPSKATWDQLWRLLEKVPTEALALEYMPYVSGLLAMWPPGLREAPAGLRAHLLGTGKEALKPVWEVIAPLVDHLVTPRNVALDALKALGSNPKCRSLRHLTIGLPLHHQEREFEALAGAEHLVALESLSLSVDHISQSAADRLLAASWFRGLRHLTLHHAQWRGRSKQVDMPELESLHLHMGEALPLLAGLGSGRHRLSALSLDVGHAVGSNPLRSLIDAPAAASIRSIRLAGYGGVELAQAICEARGLTGLEVLSLGLRYDDLSAPLQALGRALFADRLKTLEIPRSNLTPAHIESLSRAPLPALESLDLSHNAMGDAGLLHLLDAPFLPTLRHLNLARTKLTDEAVGLLTGCEALAGLQTLDLSSNAIRLKGLSRLGQPHLLAALRTLRIGGNDATDKIIQGLFASPALAGLERLDVQDSAQSVQGVFELIASPEHTLTLRADALGALLDDLTHRERWEAMKDLALKTPAHARSKRGMVGHLRDILLVDKAALARLLCSRLMIGRLKVRVLKATLHRAGDRGYSKLSPDELRARVEALLGVEGAPLLALIEG